MDIENPVAVVGTNSWGTALYGKLVRGSVVDDATIKESFEVAKQQDLLMFDLAQDYGFGKAQKMIGEFGTGDIYLSSKFTPLGRYKQGQVRASLERDLADFCRDYVDVYWLHLPTDVDENLAEVIALQQEGKIRHVGISNFNLEECKRAKELLDAAGVALYGVQNHYSLINREWEDKGVVRWCKENGVGFWAWAVLEEGMLVDPSIKTKKSIMKVIFDKKKRKLLPLYRLMREVGEAHGLTIPQVAIAYCSSKGVVPICGCRRPQQVVELKQAVGVELDAVELKQLEDVADQTGVHILGADMFRFAVPKK